MKHLIKNVKKGSIAAQLGIEAEDSLLEINGEAIVDLIDFEFLCTSSEISICISKKDGQIENFTFEKDEYESLGLEFESFLMSKGRTCANKCAFCFVDQLPPNMRESVYVKDDDWRMSLIMGNYVTLTNASKSELERMAKRQVSSLFVSVHSTDGQIRARMMGNKNADNIMEKLEFLSDNKVQIHCQIVLCKGLNDGENLTKTLNDLYCIDGIKSVAVVPVGLTKFRAGLFPLEQLSQADALDAISRIEAIADKAKKEKDTTFAFASDEMYMIAQKELLSYDQYEDFVQIENGVGIIRKFEYELFWGLEEIEKGCAKGKSYSLVTGQSAYKWLCGVAEISSNHTGAELEVHLAENYFFGKSITVAGLLTGGDILKALEGKKLKEALILPSCMLRNATEMFLDDMSVSDLSEKLGIPIKIAYVDGADFLKAIIS